MGPVSGLLLLAAAAVVVCRSPPGAPDHHDLWFWGLTAITIGVFRRQRITRWIPVERVGLGGHAFAIGALAAAALSLPFG